MRARPTSSLRLCPLLLQLHPHPCNQFLVNVAAVTAVQLQEQRAADHQGTTLAAPAPVSPSSAPPAPGEASDPTGCQPQHGLPLPQCRPLFPIFLPSPSPSKGRSRVMSLARRPSLPSFGSLNIDGHPPSPPPGPPPPPPYGFNGTWDPHNPSHKWRKEGTLTVPNFPTINQLTA